MTEGEFNSNIMPAQFIRSTQVYAPVVGAPQPNNFRKRFAFGTSCLLLLFVLVLILNAPLSAWAEETAKIELTPEEQAWLAEHPEIVLGTTTEYTPVVIKRADGTHVGMLVDVYEEVNRRLNTRIRLHIEDPWADVQEKAQNREIDGLALGAKDPSRDVFYNATDVIVPTYFSVFARSQNEYQLKRFSDLTGMRIGYKRAARPTRTLLEKLPSAILKPYDNHESMTQALLSKEIDVIVAWISYDHWRKEKLLGTIDNILLIDEYPIEMVTHIRKDWPELIPILNKAIAVLKQNDLPRIINKWFGQWPRLPTATGVTVTSEERAWLDKQHTVRVRIADWPPYLIVNDHEPPQGIAIEYLKLVGKRTGITFKLEITDQPFAEFLESMKQRQGPDMAAVIAPTPERERYLSFSETYISSPYVIFIREQDKPILDISGLAGKTVAVPRGFIVQEQLARGYPEIRLALFDSDEEALQAVATGQADAYIGNLTVASHIIHRRGFSSLQVTAACPFKEHSLSMGNRIDWPELTSMINKAVASITEEEKTEIRSKYLAIKYEKGIDKAEVLKWILITGGSTFGIVLIFLFWNRRLSREISKRMQTEEDLRQSKDEAEASNKAKSIFLANMSHELRTPLNAILGFSALLGRELDADAGQQEKLGIIKRSGEHLLSMINDVLDLSKIEAGSVEGQETSFDLVALVEEISAMIRSRALEKRLKVVVETETVGFSYVKADVGKLRQILINLLSNAVKFTDKGGVTIRCATEEPILEEQKRCHIVIEVEDTGPGIDPARQAKIFEPFAQGIDVPERKGTGLGLSIIKRYADFMGGTIELESKAGKGSLFRVRLPAKITESADVQTLIDDKPRVIGLAPTQKAWRILAVDDNRENLLLLKSLLEEVGFFVHDAKNGKEAVAAFKKESPDLVWIDMRMPVMDGYEAVQQIRMQSGGDKLPIIAITASAFTEQSEEILASGCDDMVIKPFRAHEIFEVMGRFLDIEYIYEPEREAAPVRLPEVELTAAMLADLPKEFLKELREATLSLDRETTSAVIERIEPMAPDTAKGLRKMVENFQMGRIRDLLGEVK
jgi:signal transduction histidine kinase/FixJ family two-component response regulator